MSRERVELREHESAELSLGSSALVELLEAAGDAVSLRPLPGVNRYEIKASSMVGSIRTTELDIVIRPKIPLRNVLALLEPRRHALHIRSERFEYDDNEDLTSALASFFARLAEDTLRTGMRREYRTLDDALIALRGRLRVAEQIRQPVPTPLRCRYDEYTIDTDHHRLLKAVSTRLTRAPGIGSSALEGLRRVLMLLDEVSDVLPDPDALLRRGFSRLDSHYEPVVRLAGLILQSTTINQSFGASTANAFLVDMNRVFEAFLEVSLARELRGIAEVATQFATHLDADCQVAMRPDLVFKVDGRVAFVADAKYKVRSDVLGVESDLYQLLAYTTALGVDEGLLIYAQADHSVPPGRAEISAAGKVLHGRRLDLRGSTEDIHRSVAELAVWIASRLTSDRAGEHRAQGLASPDSGLEGVLQSA